MVDVALEVLEVKGALTLKLSFRMGVSAAYFMRWRKLEPILLRGVYQARSVFIVNVRQLPKK